VGTMPLHPSPQSR